MTNVQESLADLMASQKLCKRLDEEKRVALAHRNGLMVQLIVYHHVSMYRIARMLGLSNALVKKVIDNVGVGQNE